MKVKNLITILFLFIVSCGCMAQTITKDDWLKTINGHAIRKAGSKNDFMNAPAGPALYFSQAGNTRVPYLVYVPKMYNPKEPSTVVVFLHGAILARDSFQYKEPSIAYEPIFSMADEFNILVVFPFARADFAWGRNEQANENIISITEQVEQLYHVNKKKVYIGGISMGGNATYWFVKNKAGIFAGFYAFSSLPGDVAFNNITETKPLYTMNAKDDQTFSYGEVEGIYNRNKLKVPGWHFTGVASGGHRFIYGDKGKQHMQGLLSELLDIRIIER